MNNPLTEVRFDVPFEKIRAEHVEPAIDQLLAEARRNLSSLANDTSPPTYANTLGALEDLGQSLDYAICVVAHLESVTTYPELRKAYNQVQPKVREFFSSVPLNEGVWKRLRAFSATEGARGLALTASRFLEKTVNDFRRNGAELDEPAKDRLVAIHVELATLTIKFAQNVLDATNAFDLYVESEDGLAGLPPSGIAAARASAVSKNRPGWRFTLQAPSYVAAMTYLDDRNVREELYRAFSRRATNGKFDNREIILEVLDLRREQANLLGYGDFADLVLEDRMVKDGAKAWAFVNGLRDRTKAAFDRENQELEEFAGTSLMPWDIAYQAERMRKELYDFDEEDLRPYFPYEGVIKGMFEVARRLYGISIAKRDGVEVWDKAVDAYEVRDADGSHLGSFYADYFPRENKRDGAWMDALITGEPVDGGFSPHLGLNCGNLTPPTPDRPALLTHREVETAFHEFGHLLHHLLSRVAIKSLSGTNVAWDWVELPSQIMENWCWEREALDLFARHYETGEPIPDDLFAKMHRARNFRSANAQMRQLGFATLDLALHTKYDPMTESFGEVAPILGQVDANRFGSDGNRRPDVLGYARAILQAHSPADLPADYSMVTAFTHLFSDSVGYAAGYYSYKWSEMLDADAFTRFADEGIFSRSVGMDFRRKILARGNSAEPEELFRDFMGRDPDPEALLRRLGLAA